MSDAARWMPGGRFDHAARWRSSGGGRWPSVGLFSMEVRLLFSRKERAKSSDGVEMRGVTVNLAHSSGGLDR